MSDEDTYLRQIELAKTDADTWPQWTKDAARIGEAVSDTQKMVEVTAADANNYCRVLSALGMEEEGDPVQEITSIKDQLAAARAELTNLRNDWNALQHAIVGDTGASAILTVERMRAEIERAMRVVEAVQKYAVIEYPEGLATAMREWEAGR